MKIPESQLNPGDTIDHYRIDRIVARSNDATVFHAIDLRNSKEVAVKVPHPEMESDPTYIDRFRRELQIGALLDNPGVAKVIDDPDRSGLYMVMEWFDGRTLRELLKEEQKITPERARHIAAGVCDALVYLYSHDTAHRDIRPENILVAADDRIRLIDFGGAVKTAARRFTLAKLSQAIGTSEYVSPEELKGKRGDARSDIYALGVVLYEMLTGKLPFDPSDPYDRLKHYPVPPRVIDPSISPQLQEVIFRALEREPQNRYATAHDFASDLRQLDQVGVADRPELRDWKKQRGKSTRKVLVYALLALIPIVIFALLLYMAHR